MLPALALVTTVIGVLKGPLSTIIDRYVADQELRQKLKSEIESQVIESLGQVSETQADIIKTEINAASWLTSNWRPLVMLILVSFLVWVGLILPIADLYAGYTIPYDPRWQQLPAGFWDFLSIGVGGYIGGRSLEKISAQLFATKQKK